MCYPREAELHRRSDTQSQASQQCISFLSSCLSTFTYISFLLFFSHSEILLGNSVYFLGGLKYSVILRSHTGHREVGTVSPSPPAGLGFPHVWCDGDTPTVSSTSTSKGAKKNHPKKMQGEIIPKHFCVRNKGKRFTRSLNSEEQRERADFTRVDLNPQPCWLPRDCGVAAQFGTVPLPELCQYFTALSWTGSLPHSRTCQSFFWPPASNIFLGV